MLHRWYTFITKATIISKYSVSQMFGCQPFHFDRFWDFDRDENYSLDITGIKQIGKAEVVTCIHMDKSKGKCLLELAYFLSVSPYIDLYV